MTDKCFACDKPFRLQRRFEAVTTDGQVVHVGPDCFRHVVRSGVFGYQPPMGGPRLVVPPCACGHPLAAHVINDTRHGYPARCVSCATCTGYAVEAGRKHEFTKGYEDVLSMAYGPGRVVG